MNDDDEGVFRLRGDWGDVIHKRGLRVALKNGEGGCQVGYIHNFSKRGTPSRPQRRQLRHSC